MGRVQKKGTRQPTQCTDTDAGIIPKWAWSEQQLVLKCPSSTSQEHAFPVPVLVHIGCRSESLSESLSLNGSKQITANEGVTVYTDEHQMITGNARSTYSVKVEQYREFSSEIPISIINRISPATSPHGNSELVIRQEVGHPRCSKICTGLQPLPLPSTYHSIQSHSAENDIVQLLILNHPRDFECSDCSGKQLKTSHITISESRSREESWYSVDIQRGPFYYRSHYMSKTFCECSVQETFQRQGKHELVVSRFSTTSYQSFKRHKSLHYIPMQHSALERLELYIKPFIVLAPE